MIRIALNAAERERLHALPKLLVPLVQERDDFLIDIVPHVMGKAGFGQLGNCGLESEIALIVTGLAKSIKPVPIAKERVEKNVRNAREPGRLLALIVNKVTHEGEKK